MSYLCWTFIIALIVYLLGSSYLAFSIYKRNYLYYNNNSNKRIMNIHEEYPEFNKADKKTLSLGRLLLLLPIGLIKITLGVLVAIFCVMWLK